MHQQQQQNKNTINPCFACAKAFGLHSDICLFFVGTKTIYLFNYYLIHCLLVTKYKDF